jgi:branched-subunit amino acid transport protein
MAPLTLWITIFFAGLVTYAIRLSFILLAGKIELPEWFQRALAYVPAAVFFAIIMPGVFYYQDDPAFTWRNPQILPAILAGLVAWRTKNFLLSLIVGLAAFGLMYFLL